MSFTRQIYYRLPVSLRSTAASLRGFYLWCWRYGIDGERLVGIILEREHWSAAEWTRWQKEQLASVLHRAATRVPYYREQWATRRRNGDHASWECLKNWPILQKDTVRANPNAFLADDCRTRRMFREHTSGTTGTPLDLWWSRKTTSAWYALFEVRCRRWYGVSRKNRWAILGGQLIVPVQQRTPPFWVWNLPLNQLYMSSYHLAPDLIPYYITALRKYRIEYLLGYSSSLYALAEVMKRTDQTLRLKVVVTNAEPLYPFQRNVIASAFQCPVRETYGMAELVAAASECPDGSLHLWPDVGWVEIAKSGDHDETACGGELICTSLLNMDMPLIRYLVGDRVAQTPDRSSCGCGSALPIFGQVEGRTDDTLYTRDGRRIGRLDPVFKEGLPIREAQIVQETLDTLRVRYVSASDSMMDVGTVIADRLRERMGDVHILLEPTDRIPRESNGKFRSVICRLGANGRPPSHI